MAHVHRAILITCLILSGCEIFSHRVTNAYPFEIEAKITTAPASFTTKLTAGNAYLFRDKDDRITRLEIKLPDGSRRTYTPPSGNPYPDNLIVSEAGLQVISTTDPDATRNR